MKNSLICFCLLLSVLFASGCWSHGRKFPSQHVEGIVSLDGQPVAKAIVTFQPKDEEGGDVAMGSTDENGKYKLTSSNGDPEKGALEGDYTVLISLLKVTALEKPKRVPGTSITVTTDVKQLLPTVYQDKEKTPYSVTVKKGKNKFDFPLDSKARN